MKKKRILLIITVIAITLTSCEKPVETNLTINFTNTVNGMELTTDTLIYTNSADENYSVQTLKYLISDITLYTDDGSTILLDEVHFVDISNETTFNQKY